MHSASPSPHRSGLPGLTIILSFLGLGELMSRGLGLPFPGNVLGMLLLFISLCTGLIKLEWVEAAASAILEHLGLYFVPAGVGLMLYGHLLHHAWPALVTATLFSTIAVLWTTSWVARLASSKDGAPS